MTESTPRSIETRLVQLLGAIACVALAGMLLMLPYRLYERDIRRASEEAHRVSSVMHAALTRVLEAGGDPSDLLERFQEIADFDIQLDRLADGAVHPAADTLRGSSELDGTELTYVAAPIRDQQGHGWLATMRFDLSPMKRDSIRLIIDIVLALVLSSLGFSIVLFWLIRSSLVKPLRRVARRLKKFETSGEPLEMPRFRTAEMRELVTAIERACHARSDPR